MARSSNPALDRAIEAAESVVRKVTLWYSTKECLDWTTLERKLGITIAPQFKLLKFDRVGIAVWGSAYIKETPRRFDMQSMASEEDYRIKWGDVVPRTYGNFTLFKEQQASADAVCKRFDEDNLGAILINGMTGCGKTPIAVAIAAEWLKKPKKAFSNTRVIILTRFSVVEDFKDHFRQMGLERELNNGTILVYSYSTITARSMIGLYCDIRVEVDELNETEQTIWTAKPALQPELFVLDESQSVNLWNSRRAKLITAISGLPEMLRPHFVFQTATAFTKVNDCRNFVLCANFSWQDSIITKDNFATFARFVSKGTDPTKPNAAAMRRLRQILGKYVVDVPRVKWKCKSYNTVLPLDFANKADQEYYAKSEARFIEFLRNSGKAAKDDVPEINYLTELIIFRRGAEPAHVAPLLPHILKDIAEKRYPIIAWAYRDSLIRMVLALEREGIPRELLSIIWGGSQEIKMEYVLNSAQIMELAMKQMQGYIPTARDKRCIKMTAEYLADRARNQETDPEVQAIRLAKMRELGLHRMQTREERQIEKNRFRDGETVACLCTITTGGVGISLDHSRWASRTRRTYGPPIYSAHEFTQLFGRGLRRTTVTDIYQFCCLLRNTIEEAHVGPVLDRTLLSLGSFTGAGFMKIMKELQESVAIGAHNRIRTIEEVRKEVDSCTDVDTFNPIVDMGSNEDDGEGEEDDDED